ncbi:MAG: 50S ribosomal protein L23 [bacterium]
MEYSEVLYRPLVTEKSVGLQEKKNKYTFEVNPRANKIQIKDAVEKQFNVSVENVRTMNMHGKQRRVRYNTGYTGDWKKAVVTLAENDHIEIVEGLAG